MQSMVAANWPPLQSMGLHGFVLGETRIDAKGVQEESVKIWEVLSAKSHAEKAVASDGCSHTATKTLKTKTHASSGCQRHCPERNLWFLPHQEISIINGRVYRE